MTVSKTIIPVYNLSCEHDALDHNTLNIRIIVKNDKELASFFYNKLNCDDDIGYQDYEINDLIHIIKNISSCFKASKVCITFDGVEPLIYARAIKGFINLAKSYRWTINIVTPLICEIEDLCLVLDNIDNWYILSNIFDKKDSHYNLYYNNSQTNLAILLDCIDKNKLNMNKHNKLYELA